MPDLRSTIRSLMVDVHKITPELAALHVADMDEEEMQFRLEMYRRMGFVKPLCVDLYCGLGGWAEGFLTEGYRVVGFDIERYQYPGELVLADVLSLSGSSLVNEYGIPALIVASPPCQEPSYRAMPWTRAQRLNRKGPPHNFIALFEACFRIRLEASLAAGRYIPLVVENVRGARRWVGWSKANYGSYYLWGDIPTGLPRTSEPKVVRNHINKRDGHAHTRHLTNKAEHVKQHGSGRVWFDIGIAALSSQSKARKKASAEIAKIPFPLAQWIARCYKPDAFAFGARPPEIRPGTDDSGRDGETPLPP